MQPNTRLLCISAIAAVVGLGTLDIVYGRYAGYHFVPNVKLQHAEAAGTACLLTLGDSRMDAGIDAPVLRDALRLRGVDICIAPLAVGALPISGQAMALRRLVHDGRKPSWVVLGAGAETVLEDPSPPDPRAFSGNRAAELAWSEPMDTYRYYPNFPFADLDSGARFWFARSNALSIYASAVWMKTQGLQDRLLGSSPNVPYNRFGSLTDMEALVATFRKSALKKFAASKGQYRFDRWFELVRLISHEAGAHLIIIEVPMHSGYRAEVVDSVAGQRYHRWLKGELARSGDLFFDLSLVESVRDQNFSDGIHLDRAGAKAFSADLGETLAPLLMRKSVEGQPP